MENRNHFTDKFTKKSNQELIDILKSDQYVDEAKLASKWILKKRGHQTNYQLPTKSSKKPKPFIVKNQDPESRKYFESKLMILGISFIICAFYINFDNLFITKKSLVELKGTNKNSKVFVENVSSRNRIGYEAKSRRATLYFSLNEYNKLFKLQKNIGQDYSHVEYNRISNSLSNSKKVTVWINQTELNDFNPKVFQISANGTILLDYETVKSEHSGIFLFLLLLGFGATGFALYNKYPLQRRNILGMNETDASKTK